jgi:hypothetical protein
MLGIMSMPIMATAILRASETLERLEGGDLKMIVTPFVIRRLS